MFIPKFSSRFFQNFFQKCFLNFFLESLERFHQKILYIFFQEFFFRTFSTNSLRLSGIPLDHSHEILLENPPGGFPEDSQIFLLKILIKSLGKFLWIFLFDIHQEILKLPKVSKDIFQGISEKVSLCYFWRFFL